MKAKYFFLCLAIGAMALFNVSCDDDVTPSDVPAAVMTKFQQMYPDITAKWEKDKNGQLKAEFYSDYHEMEVWFQKDGTWVMTKKDISVNELPKTVLDYLTANYRGVEIDDADWVETPTEKYYLVELDKDKGNDIYLKFNEAGELIQ